MTAVTNETTTTADVAETASKVRDEQARLQGLEDELTDVEIELVRLESHGGEEFLDNPGLVRELPAKLSELRARSEILTKAIAAQRTRVAAAESAYLTAEADAYEPNVAAAQALLDQHTAKVDKAIADLALLEGAFVPDDTERLSADCGRPGCALVGQTHGHYRQSDHLRRALVTEQQRVEVLRAMAKGQDPDVLVRQWAHEATLAGLAVNQTNFYPPCVWRPDAVVVAPVLINRRERARTWLEELERIQEEIPNRIAALWENAPQRMRKVLVDGTVEYETLLAGYDPAAEAKIPRLEARLAELPGEIAAARAALEDLG